MAFPQTAAPTATTFTADQSSYAFDLPATINAGDLLLCLWAAGTTSSHGTTGATDSTSDAWTQIYSGSGTTGSGGVFAKVADGDEDSGTVTVGLNTTAHSGAGQVYRITGWGGTIADDIDSNNGVVASATPDPGSVTAGWGSADNLFFAVLSYFDDAATVSSYPTNYLNGTAAIVSGGSNNSCAVASARRELAADSDDPGAYTLSELEGVYWGTLVIEPSAGGLSIPIAMYHYLNH